jgi:exosome complex exonuclease RRP6
MVKNIEAWAARAQAKAKAGSKGRVVEEAEDEDDQANVFARIADIVDGLLEKADICLDEYSGKVEARASTSAASMTNSNGIAQRPAASNGQAPPRMGKLPAELLNAQIEPPQRRFTYKPDNRADTVWHRGLSRGKPNALVPESWRPPPPGPGEPFFEPGTVRQGMYCAEGDPKENPYFYEIFHSEPPTYVYQPPSEEELQPPPPLIAEVPEGVCGVPFTWIDTAEGVERLASHLEEDRVKEIAIDLEAHAHRSYQGIACLMQLSTRWGDYILDLLADPVRLNTERLNTSFTNASKVKILHGAEHDILWLQRDCGLYLVNLFDTYHATNVLSFPGHGLAYLLSRYYDFEADKRYQLADWRIRPLPKEMMYYARSDTHSLIYVYNRLRAEILTTGGKPAMDEVFNRSKITSARRYAKEVWDESGNSREGWRSMWRRMGGEEARGTDLRMEVSQMGRTERLVRRLHQWRDGVAREEDESPKYILSAQNLLNLASRAPMTKSEAMVMFTPGIPAVRKRAGEVARIIKEEVLAWEQDQSLAQKKAKAEMEKAAESGLVTADQEDLGVTAGAETAMADPGNIASSSSSTTSPGQAQDLWGGSSAARPVMRSSHSSLFGGLRTEPERSAHEVTNQIVEPLSLQSSLYSALQSVVGTVAAIVGGGGPPDSIRDTSAPIVKDETPEPVPNGHAIALQDHTQDGLVAVETGINQPAEKDERETSPASSDSSAGDDAMEGYDVVNVKKSKQKKKDKSGWSNAQKRKARQERSAQSAAEEQNKKTRVSPDSDVQPFDYSAAQSILDAPPPARPSSGSAGQKKIRKGKRDREQREGKPTGPDRFADLPQPKDRTGLSGAGRSATFK